MVLSQDYGTTAWHAWAAAHEPIINDYHLWIIVFLFRGGETKLPYGCPGPRGKNMPVIDDVYGVRFYGDRQEHRTDSVLSVHYGVLCNYTYQQ